MNDTVAVPRDLIEQTLDGLIILRDAVGPKEQAQALAEVRPAYEALEKLLS